MICWVCKKEVDNSELSYDPILGILRTYSEHKEEREKEGYTVYPFYCLECGTFNEGGIFYRLNELVKKMWEYRPHTTYEDRRPEFTWRYGDEPDDKHDCFVRWFMRFNHGGCVDDAYIQTWRKMLEDEGFFLKSWRIDFNSYHYPEKTYEFSSRLEKLGDNNKTYYDEDLERIKLTEELRMADAELTSEEREERNRLARELLNEILAEVDNRK